MSGGLLGGKAGVITTSLWTVITSFFLFIASGIIWIKDIKGEMNSFAVLDAKKPPESIYSGEKRSKRKLKPLQSTDLAHERGSARSGDGDQRIPTERSKEVKWFRSPSGQRSDQTEPWMSESSRWDFDPPLWDHLCPAEPQDPRLHRRLTDVDTSQRHWIISELHFHNC